MQTIQVQTTQNVGIQYDVAGLGDRILAYIIDGVIAVTYFLVVLFFIGRLFGTLSIWVYILFYLPMFFYHLASEVFMDGQSIGKKQFGLKVVRLDGHPVTLGNYIMRWMLRLVDISMTSGGAALLSIAVTKDGQRLGDLAAGTTVVKIRPQRSIQSHEVIRTMESDYEPVYQAASQLTTRDVDMIRQALAAYKSTGNAKPILAITEKVKNHLNIESEQPAVTLLYTVLKDYSHLTSQ